MATGTSIRASDITWQVDEAPPPQPEGSAQRWPLVFEGSGSEYFRIWIVNLLLTLVTLGLYYPFAKVRRLRYFHGATLVAGHPLAFHGEGRKMLRGYLLVGLLLGAYSVAGQVDPWAGVVALAVVALIWPALWHASLRFRLANTSWRGLRLRFTGRRSGAYRALALPALAVLAVVLLAAWAAPEVPVQAGPEGAPAPGADNPAGRVPNGRAPAEFSWPMLLPLVPVLLLPLLAPAVLWMMRRYQHSHFAIGDEQCRFDVRCGPFYKLMAKTVGLSMAAGALAALLAGGVMALLGTGSNLGAGQDNGRGFAGVLSSLLPLLLMVLLAYGVIGPYFTARLQDLCWNGTRSTRLWFESRLSARALAGLSVKNWLLMALTLGLYYPFAAVASARLRLQAVALCSDGDLDSLWSTASVKDESAAGDAAADLFGFDLGL